MKRLFASLLAAALFGSLPLFAAPVRNGHVVAELVSSVASVQPGHPLTVALRLQHDEHWHTYWLNPGTGLPTSLTWHLPAGWTAGDIQWPTPTLVKDTRGNIAGMGYDGEIFLLVTLTPPANLPAGTDVTLSAEADWLMCSEECVPGEANLTLTLPVANATPPPDPAWSAKIAQAEASLPQTLANWRLAATRSGATVTLTVTPAGAPSAHTPQGLYFFSADGLIDYEQPQTVQAKDGSFVITLPIADSGPKDDQTLTGVLSSANGWNSDGSAPGLAVNVSFTAKTAAAPTAAVAGTTVKPSAPNAVSGSPSVPPPAPPATDSSLAATLLFAFLGGLILNLMPCVFPVLGIKILGFVNQSGHHRARVVKHGLVFTLGVLLSFWALAGLLIALRAGGQQLGWGFQLQSPAFVFGMAVFLLIFALNLSGLFEFGLAATGVGGGLAMKEGYTGSFFTGLLATLVSTPCAAPFLAPALGVALTLSAAQSLLIFTLIALGLAAPYLLLSIFPAAIRILPRPGAWMETFKQLMAFPLYATVGWLLWVLAAEVSEDGLFKLILSLVVIAMGCWVYGRMNRPAASAARRRAGQALTLALLVAGCWGGWPATPPAAGSAQAAQSIAWQKWSPDTVTQLLGQGKIVYVDFTARWCMTCQVNKKLVFSSQKVLDTFHRHGVVALEADWTRKDPQITEALAKFGRAAVPFNLIYIPGHAGPIVLPEVLSPGTVLDALARAGVKS